MILKFISPSPDLSPDLQTHVFSCLPNTSIWMPNKHLKLTTDKTEKLTLPHQNIDTDRDLEANTDTNTGKEIDVDKAVARYILPLPSLPHSFIKQIFIERLPSFSGMF